MSDQIFVVLALDLSEVSLPTVDIQPLDCPAGESERERGRQRETCLGRADSAEAWTASSETYRTEGKISWLGLYYR